VLHLEVDSYLGNELKVMNTRLEARGRVQSSDAIENLFLRDYIKHNTTIAESL